MFLFGYSKWPLQAEIIASKFTGFQGIVVHMSVDILPGLTDGDCRSGLSYFY